MSREVLDSRSSYDEVYDDRPERDRRPRPSRRLHLPPELSRKLRSVAPLVAAFAVGLVVGVGAWDEWLEQRDVTTARSAVSFLAQMSSADAMPDGIDARVRMTNIGPEPVQVTGIEIHDSEVMSSSHSRADAIEVLPGRFVTLRVSLKVDCAARDAAEPGVAIGVRTVDGVTRSAEVPLDDANNALDDATTILCPDPNDGFLPLYVTGSGSSTIIDDGGQPALRTPISLSSWTPVDVTVHTMRTLTRNLSVSVTGLPLELSGDEGDDQVLAEVTWRVDDCRDAGDLRFEAFGFVLEAQRPGGIVITSRVESDPNLALDVANFVADTCQTA